VDFDCAVRRPTPSRRTTHSRIAERLKKVRWPNLVPRGKRLLASHLRTEREVVLNSLAMSATDISSPKGGGLGLFFDIERLHANPWVRC
jgi:hypothetical protein